MSYALNIPSGITSVGWSISVAKVNSIAVYELAGVATTSAVDGSNVGSGGTASTAQVDPSLTPSVAGDIYIGAICVPAGTLAVNQAGSAPTSGWNGQTTLVPTNHAASNGYQVLAGTSASSLAWTLGTSGVAGLVGMLFLAAAAAGTPRPRPAVLPRLAVVSAASR